MGLPTPEELAGTGPPIRVCPSCMTDDDSFDGGSPKSMTIHNPRGPWSTCKRCGRRSRIIYLVDRTPTDQPENRT